MLSTSLLFLFVSNAIADFVDPRDHLVNRKHQALQDCLHAKAVPTTLNSSSDWTSLTTAFNLRLQYTPVAVTIPENPQQVSDSITCAAAAGIKVQPRSGGHSYGSYSLGGKNGSLTIDLQKFNEVSLDKGSGIVRAGGGVRLGNLGLGVYKQGQAALPHGTYPGVGIGGHYTHGGFGYSSRRWGLALDTIVAMDVVLADGTQLHVTRTTHPELYYALRGAADSIGVVTTFYLQTQPAPAQIVSYSVNFTSALKSSSSVADVLLQLQKFAQSSPLMDRNITLEIYMNIFGTFEVRGWYFGDPTHFSSAVLPAMLEGLPKADNTTIATRNWLDALQDIAEGEPLVEPLTGYNNHQTFYTKSIVTREAKPLTRRALESFAGYVISKGLSAESPWETYISLYGGRDSQINVPSPDSAAYSHRDSLWVFQNIGSSANMLPPFESGIKAFVQGLNTALTDAQPDGDFLAYPNYLDPELTPAEAHRLYYGDATYGKLSAIKKVVDPSEVFWNPQAIGN